MKTHYASAVQTVTNARTDLIGIFWLGPVALYMHAKFKVSSFNRSGDTRGVPKFKSKSPGAFTGVPFRRKGVFAVGQAEA